MELFRTELAEKLSLGSANLRYVIDNIKEGAMQGSGRRAFRTQGAVDGNNLGVPKKWQKAGGLE